jgi:hypothetical protein
MNNCVHCNRRVEGSRNYCDWACHIKHAKSLGLEKYTPNNLPIKCITTTHMLEVEHGDHIHYKYPGSFHVKDKTTCDEIEEDIEYIDSGAIIYFDDNVVLILSECSYKLFSINDGYLIEGYKRNKNERLTEETISWLKSQEVK